MSPAYNVFKAFFKSPAVFFAAVNLFPWLEKAVKLFIKTYLFFIILCGKVKMKHRIRLPVIFVSADSETVE